MQAYAYGIELLPDITNVRIFLRTTEIKKEIEDIHQQMRELDQEFEDQQGCRICFLHSLLLLDWRACF